MNALRAKLAALAAERAEALRPPGYRRVAGAMLVTNLGNGAQFIANVWLVLQLTDSPRAVSLVLLTTALPGVFFGPIIGVLMDRYARRLVFATSDIFAALVLAVTVTLYLTHRLETWHLFTAVFLLALSESTSVPTGTALVREIIPVDRLLSANATTGVAVQIGNVIGAAAGGIIIAVSSVAGVLVLNMVSFVLSAVLIIGVRTARRIERDGGAGWKESIRSAAKGLDYLRSHPKMLPSYGMLLVLFATLYLLNTLLAPFAENVLDVGASGLGFIDAMFAIGAIAGGVLLPLFTARLNRDRIAALGVIGMGIALIALGGSSGLAVPMLLYAAAGVCFQSFYIFRTRVQEQVPVGLQGRVMALLIMSVGMCRLVVYGILAIFASTAALRGVYAAGGAALAVLGIIVTITAFRRPEASTPPTDPDLAAYPLAPADPAPAPVVSSERS
ncbi:MFS transporter [Winogradskya consettensis]|uniref:MFS transporter n=1 Tax=Winogradskya consettensis TaxID=113560 RepID=A0A919T0C8_9ACTN|nr:MFS transporter [Actinoplanes consettensis]GIM82294.1 MFS transporter [Actinoplanes consettensis]